MNNNTSWKAEIVLIYYYGDTSVIPDKQVAGLGMLLSGGTLAEHAQGPEFNPCHHK